MADLIYNSYAVDLMSGNIDHDADNFYIMLVTSSYVANQDTHEKRSDVTNEISGTGYTTAGKILTSLTVTKDNTNNRSLFDAADLSWTSATFSADAAVLYKNRGGASSADELIKYFDFGSTISVTAGTFTIVFHADGILALAT